MGICATPECGTPGRPFPACSVCKQRRYCGSHCLKQIHNAETMEMVQDSGDVQSVELKEGDLLCPPCVLRIQKTSNTSSVDFDSD